jgi:hypothetical protein
MELREKIAAVMRNEDCGEGWCLCDHASEVADAILAIPEIRDALKLADTLPEREKRLRLL